MSKQESTLIKLFKKYDKDGSGYLDIKEFHKVMGMIYFFFIDSKSIVKIDIKIFLGEIEPDATNEEINKYFVKMDKDKSHRIEMRGIV